MKNDSYHQAKEKASEMRLKKRIETLNTPIDEREEPKYKSMSISEVMNCMKDSLDELNKNLEK